MSDARINTIVNNCIDNPFGTTADEYGRGGCAKTLGAEDHITKTTQRIELCNNTDNEDDPLCMDANRTNICNYDPFTAVCFFEGNEYVEARKTKITTCRLNPDDTTCYSANLRPNIIAWEKSFVTESSPAELPSVADTATRSQFLKGRKTDLNETGITNVKARGALHFETAPVEDTPLSLLLPTNPEPTDTDIAKEGVAFFWGWERGKYAFYAGILEGTDLGAPVKSVSGTEATWSGKFQ